MPKRSNDFQQLIKRIYAAMASDDATVQESVMLKEKHSSSNREVDILIEQSIAGHKIKIAVECRDKSRKDDITWIDDVIGKYADLEVDKIVAISRSGFSQPAIEKAIEHKIDTITLKQALRRN